MFDKINDIMFIIAYAIFAIPGIGFFYYVFLRPWLDVNQHIKKLDRLQFEHDTRQKFATLFDEKNYKITQGGESNFTICTLKHIPSGQYIKYSYCFDPHCNCNWPRRIILPELITEIMNKQEKDLLQEFLTPLAVNFIQQHEEQTIKWAQDTFISKEYK